MNDVAPSGQWNHIVADTVSHVPSVSGLDVATTAAGEWLLPADGARGSASLADVVDDSELD